MRFYFGDRSFNQRLAVYYSWFLPVVTVLFSIPLFLDGCWIVAAALVSLGISLTPWRKQHSGGRASKIWIIIHIAVLLIGIQLYVM